MNSVYRRAYELANEDFWNSPQSAGTPIELRDKGYFIISPMQQYLEKARQEGDLERKMEDATPNRSPSISGNDNSLVELIKRVSKDSEHPLRKATSVFRGSNPLKGKIKVNIDYPHIGGVKKANVSEIKVKQIANDAVDRFIERNRIDKKLLDELSM